MKNPLEYIHYRLGNICSYIILYKIITIQSNTTQHLNLQNQTIFIDEVSEFVSVSSSNGVHFITDRQQKQHEIEHENLITVQNYSPNQVGILKYYEVTKMQ